MVLPGGTATEQLDQAVLAEQAGWDGVFVWEAAYGVDAWSLLAAIAARTAGSGSAPCLPLPWRRPWGGQPGRHAGPAVRRPGPCPSAWALTDLPDTGEVTGTRPRASLMNRAST